MPRVSIGLPVFNGRNFLKEAVDSILAQTYSDFEVIISDNASTDGTHYICKEYAAKDRRICFYRTEVNHGAAWNYNRVLELSSGEYFKWMAHDDVITPVFLQRCVPVLDRDLSVVVAYAKTAFIDEHGRVTGHYEPDTEGFDSARPHERFAVRTSRVRPPFPFLGRRLEDVHAIFGLIRASALKASAPLGSYGASDHILLARLALLGRFQRIPEYLFLNRDHPDRSKRAYCGRSSQTLWLDPKMQGKVFFAEWKMFWEFVRSVHQSTLDSHERVHCYLETFKYFLWNWPRLALDVFRTSKRILFALLKRWQHGCLRLTRRYRSV